MAVPKRPLRRVLKKLVRDKIAEEIVDQGRSFRKLEVIGSLREFLLRRKAIEEIYELCSAESLESLKEELADVFEILYALAAEHQIPIDEIESIRVAKKAARGGFDKGIFIDYVASGNPDQQIGLFGSMDYLSVTKRIPRQSAVRIEE